MSSSKNYQTRAGKKEISKKEKSESVKEEENNIEKIQILEDNIKINLENDFQTYSQIEKLKSQIETLQCRMENLKNEKIELKRQKAKLQIEDEKKKFPSSVATFCENCHEVDYGGNGHYVDCCGMGGSYRCY